MSLTAARVSDRHPWRVTTRHPQAAYTWAVSDVFVFLGSYATEEDAQADYDAVKELHGAGRLSSYDAAVLVRDASGQVLIEKDELPRRHGAWTGAAVGALAGLLVPPTAVASRAASDGLARQFRNGLAEADLRELGDVLGTGRAALVVVAGSKVADLLDERLTNAIATIEKTVAANTDFVAALRV